MAENRSAPSDQMFVVQEHHATRLHCDSRLEIGGVLKSWAIPKGPSMNPADKRLAVMVDDHPLEYGTFEGIIPEGRYGAGPVVVWDQGTFTLLEGTAASAGLKSGSLKFELSGRQLKGVFALIQMRGPRTSGNEWLLIKKNDRYADLNFTLESSLTPWKRKQLRAIIPSCNTS
jgi:bifunctional non-homologous end joining protein LigD